MSVRLSGRIKKKLWTDFAAHAKNQSHSMTKALKLAIADWLSNHAGKSDLKLDDGRQRRGDTSNMNIDVAEQFKRTIDLEVARRKGDNPPRFPASVVDLVEESMREYMKKSENKS